MTLRELCRCGHAKDTHARETVSTGDVNQERHFYWGVCLGVHCECPEYREPPDDDA